MKKLFLAGSLMALLVPVAAIAQSKFDGTWKIDSSKQRLSTKPYVYLLQDGIFDCKSCTPPIHVKADGQDHKFVGSPYADTENVKVVDDHAVVVTGKKNGKIVRTNKLTVSSDGATATVEFNDDSDTNADPVTGKLSFTRLSAGPAGSHAISGSWQLAGFTQSDNGATFTLKVEGDSVTMTTPTGQSYTAKLDGTDAPYNGDPGTTSVSVKRVGAATIIETDKRAGKVISVTRMTVSADGKTITLVNNDLLTGRIFHDVAVKQ
jgi:hypothetical protein